MIDSEESEFFDSSSSESTSTSVIKDERESFEKNRKLRKYVFLLLFSVLFLVLMNVILIFIVLILSYKMYFREVEGISHVPKYDKPHQYSFIHSKNGVTDYSGYVSFSDPIPGKFMNIITATASGGSAISLVYDEEIDPRPLFEFEFDLYCCPEQPNKERRELVGCRRIVEGIRGRAFGEDEKDVSENALNELLVYNRESSNPCTEFDETLEFEVTELRKLNPLFDCSGSCKPSKYENFIASNEGLHEEMRKHAEKTNPELVKGKSDQQIFNEIDVYLRYQYLEASKTCSEGDISLQTVEPSDEISSDVEKVTDHFQQNVLSEWCQSMYMKFSNWKEKKSFDLCVANKARCELNHRSGIISFGKRWEKKRKGSESMTFEY